MSTPVTPGEAFAVQRARPRLFDRLADPSERVQAVLLLAPAALLLGLIVVYPIARLIYTRFSISACPEEGRLPLSRSTTTFPHCTTRSSGTHCGTRC